MVRSRKRGTKSVAPLVQGHSAVIDLMYQSTVTLSFLGGEGDETSLFERFLTVFPFSLWDVNQVGGVMQCLHILSHTPNSKCFLLYIKHLYVLIQK